MRQSQTSRCKNRRAVRPHVALDARLVVPMEDPLTEVARILAAGILRSRIHPDRPVPTRGRASPKIAAEFPPQGLEVSGDLRLSVHTG
jgi:hypothetical protein